MRAVVLVSGGMDSLVAAARAIDAGHECAFLHVTYGQKTAERERKAFEDICDHYQPYKRVVADISYLAQIGGSALTDPNIPVPDAGAAAPTGPVGAGLLSSVASAKEDAPPKVGDPTGAQFIAPGGPPIPATYVPFRNAHLIAIAASLAEVEDASQVYIGVSEVDYSGYPDCRREFFDAMEEAIEEGTKPETHIRIITPLIRKTKGEIVKEGQRLEAPFELTWSCYRESETACGRCDSCRLRLKGFEEAEAEDPLQYMSS